MSLYDEQMESWLEFAYKEYTENRNSYRQGQTGLKPGRSLNGKSKYRAQSHWRTKTDHYSFNNWECFKNWKGRTDGKWTMYHVTYQDAVVTMHQFFDYMEALV